MVSRFVFVVKKRDLRISSPVSALSRELRESGREVGAEGRRLQEYTVNRAAGPLLLGERSFKFKPGSDPPPEVLLRAAQPLLRAVSSAPAVTTE